MTSVLRYRAEEDGANGEIVPPKPHRLKPLEGEAGYAAEGATNTEDATANTSAIPRPPDRPGSQEGPKTRMVKASASGAQAPGLAETVDSMSAPSTADTVTNAVSVEDQDRIEKAKKAGQRVSMSDDASLGAALQEKRNTEGQPSAPGTGWANSAGEGSARLQPRRSMVGAPDATGIHCTNPREVCSFYYRQAEQKWLWQKMQKSSETLLDSDSIVSMKTVLAPNDAGDDTGVSNMANPDVLTLLGDDEELPEAKPPQKTEAIKAPKENKARRQSTYILPAEAVEATPAEPAPKKHKKKGKKDEASDAASESAGPVAAAGAPTGPHPLKELMTAKKVVVDPIRAVLQSIDVKAWIDAPLDVGPPLVPKPVVFATALNDPGLVDLMIEYGADVRSPYDGPSMYKGWVKPGATLVSSVQNRKGRFKGTMLADKLTQIEMALIAAMAAQHGKAGQPESDDEKEEEKKDEEEIQIVEETIEAGAGIDGEPTRRKSVAVKITGGSTMRHTQGHPGDVFEISEHLSDGDRSSVWLGFHKDTKAPVAIKTEQKSTAIEAWLWEEINLMRKVEHPSIAQLYETFESEKQIFLVLELCEGGRLLDKCTPEDCALILKSPKLMRQTTTAVQFLHSKQIAHRDIQLDNFLLADEKRLSEATVKLIDFTTAKMFGPDQPPLKTKICTPGYVAKEILTRKEIPYTEKVDVWSLGVVFFILLSGTPPFAGATDFDTLKQVKKGAFKFEPEDRWALVPVEAKQLIAAMINPSVEDRLSSSAVLAHPFIANA